jgi:tetratricopeptide (TPR) repeat protein
MSEGRATGLAVFLGLGAALSIDVKLAFLQTKGADAVVEQYRKLFEQGRYSEAIPLVQRALAIQEKIRGPNHPAVATQLNNLAALYDYQGRHANAKPLLKRSLAMREKTLGPNHPDVANSLNNLAEAYRKQGRFTDAEPLYRRSLAIHEKALGPNHPDVASSLSNLALLIGKVVSPTPNRSHAIAGDLGKGTWSQPTSERR